LILVPQLNLTFDFGLRSSISPLRFACRSSIAPLILGGAALQRCDRCIFSNPALAAEGETSS
jgi:hypothetical protein